MPTKILIVDDQEALRKLVRMTLEGPDFTFQEAYTGDAALEMLDEFKPDMVILDVMMPNLNGIETCEKLRQDDRFLNTIIMFLTARGEDYSFVAAFDVGADDYVTKPIKPKVLVSKVKGLLRRFKEDIAPKTTLDFYNLVINREEYKLLIDGEERTLPRKEFELLYLLASKPGKVFKRDVIMEKVWGNEVVVGDRTIDVHIRKLREKLGDQFFKTIKGVGYTFVKPEN